MKALWLLALAGCLDSTSIVCGDHMICPDDQVCAHVTDPDQDLCADPAQLQACEGLATYTRCGANGRCYDGVCLPVSCGNGRIDRPDPSDPNDEGEVCDDHNERSGDGCASDCRSNETCGNGVVDAVDLERCDDGDQISNDGCASVCQSEHARWVFQWPLGVLGDGQAFSYDLMRDRLVMFGGHLSDSTTSGETWEGTETGFTQRAPAQSPSPRSGAAMVYDLARRETVLFGGGPSGETWIWDGTTWSQRMVADGPSPRVAHGMAYDARRARTVLFGGVPDGLKGPAHDTWEWDGTTWRQIATATSPGARSTHAMTYDPHRGVVVMWGGSLDDTSVWEYDGVDWREVASTGDVPRPRLSPSLAYDPIRERVMLIGGLLDDHEVGDVWSWDGTRWERLDAPVPRFALGHVATTDLRHGHVVVLGRTYEDLVPLGIVPATWIWDGASWGYQAVDHEGPTETHSVALDTDRAELVAIGHESMAELEGTGWTAPAIDPGGRERTQTAIAFDPRHHETMLFGGLLTGPDALSVAAGDTWVWRRPGWFELQPTTTPPARAGERLAFDQKTRTVTMFGGAACVGSVDCALFDDTWEWDGDDWHLAQPSHRPPPRQRPAFAYDPIHEQIVMFGGAATGLAHSQAIDDLLGDTWTWDGVDWTERHPAEQPTARDAAAMAWDGNRGSLILYGGTTSLSYANSDVWEWDGTTWARETVTDAPIRTGHAMATASGAGVVMMGGSTSLGSPVDGTWVLRWEGVSPTEACRAEFDGDGDGLAGCADPDCWWVCTPACPPGAPCDPAAPHCGDGVCNGPLEDGWICPADCRHPAMCGDAFCDPEESQASCPGDCP